jgi:hypothetical protein
MCSNNTVSIHGERRRDGSKMREISLSQIDHRLRYSLFRRLDHLINEVVIYYRIIKRIEFIKWETLIIIHFPYNTSLMTEIGTTSER